VIRADTSPTKMMPAAGDPNQKPISERLAGGAGERVERREEDPVDLSRATASGVMGGGGGPYTGLPSSAAAQPSSGPASLTDPKKVRTVTIRADQGSPAPAAAPPSRGSQRQAAVAPSNGAPMAIAPDASPARAAAPPPAPRASDSAAGGGGYVVQLMAAKTEADAQAAFRSAQTKYAALNGRQPLIRRKDTDHGVFYAAQVGPFGAKGDAEQLCETLKSSGGNCWVYRN
jgi:cell division septation protein DedD